MTPAIWRISAWLNIPLSPELAEKQANVDGNFNFDRSTHVLAFRHQGIILHE